MAATTRMIAYKLPTCVNEVYPFFCVLKMKYLRFTVIAQKLRPGYRSQLYLCFMDGFPGVDCLTNFTMRTPTGPQRFRDGGSRTLEAVLEAMHFAPDTSTKAVKRRFSPCF